MSGRYGDLGPNAGWVTPSVLSHPESIPASPPTRTHWWISIPVMRTEAYQRPHFTQRLYTPILVPPLTYGGAPSGVISFSHPIFIENSYKVVCDIPSLNSVSVADTRVFERRTEALGNVFLAPDLAVIDKGEFGDGLDDIVREKGVKAEGIGFGPLVKSVNHADGGSGGHWGIVCV